MGGIYSFFLNRYSWVIAAAMIPYIHLIRRYCSLRFGVVRIVRTKSAAAVIRGRITGSYMINLYGRDGALAGISAVLISAGSCFVPCCRNDASAAAACICSSAGVVLYLVSALWTHHQIARIRKKIRSMSMKKITDILSERKNQTDRH